MTSGVLPVVEEPHPPQALPAGLIPVTVGVYASVGVAGVLLSLLVVTVMSARKTQSPTASGTFPKRSKKVRSISVSVDLECPESLRLDKKMSHGYFLRSCEQRYRTVSECVGPGAPDGMVFHKKHYSAIKFPFQSLPVDCKLKVLSFLGPLDRGTVGMVCQEWNILVKTPTLWGSVDFTMFPRCHSHMENHKDCTRLCYSLYKSRMKKFMAFLQGIRPVLKRVRLAFDIGDHEDSWLESLNNFFDAAHLRELEFLNFNWYETPAKPYLEAGENLTWSSSDANAFSHKLRYRQRLFVNFFDHLTARAPSINKLVIPFEWSARSIHALSRLARLDSIVLEKYFTFQCLNQDSLDQLFISVPNLRNLILEVYTPSGPGLQFYSMNSLVLQYLDISQCRGFYPQSMQLANLEVFKLSRSQPWNGPISATEKITVPCVYRVLCEGCPSLKQINEHILKPGWQHMLYPELQVVFKSVCSCREHKSSGWEM